MKQLAILGVVLAFLVTGCGSREEPAPATEPVETDTGAEVLDEAEAPAAEAEAAADETPLEVVEESAAVEEVVEEEDKPIMLAPEEAPAAATAAAQPAREWKYQEGTHYARMVPTQPTVGGPDKIEVAEFFWYGCNHCFDFEPYVNRWAESLDPNVRFVRVPALWNPLVRLHGRLYYTEEVLARNGKLADVQGFHSAAFLEIHRRGNRLASEAAIQALFERFGVSADDFKSTWESFEVAQKLRVAEDLARRYEIASVPAIVVNGKYRTGAGEAGSYPKLLELIDELVERESIR
ncbi:MAG: thiol:disulfide interchange protein DsbA/DsbL [Gammaproteobacteria bacterium]|nr:thiol:disulfide interchange protein DsbA/DsbL [Gammaproteobacteria bacterium]MDH4255868.1 thiol:disulfide interchange protein DsbA/DsbL [Gammaproteobacteria bacterium]MDH5310650.1 thiol:disulfide interchange protein DsbA/DsbL [Gammaproteobacteria bacterium]